MRNYLLAAGIMTGNSLDGVDAVLTRFETNGAMSDLVSVSLPSPPELSAALRELRSCVEACAGNTDNAEQSFNSSAKSRLPDAIDGAYSLPPLTAPFERVHTAYLMWMASAVRLLLSKAAEDVSLRAAYDLSAADIVGVHGQTCAHMPPSIAKTRDAEKVYTVQLGSGQMLADLLGMTVVYDFRSDDLMNGGEGAPLAPLHHQHLAEDTRRRGFFPIAFCNGGNTGNISIITSNTASGAVEVRGWDTGPFNHFPDSLMRSERQMACDVDGAVGSTGNVNMALLELLFDKAVRTKDGDNFLSKSPPRSSDPQWYRTLPELAGTERVAGADISFEDRLRTAEYFSAYTFFYSLSFVPAQLELPKVFAICGGGWKNPVVRRHFEALCNGDTSTSPVLPAHRTLFADLAQRLGRGARPLVCDSRDVGFDGGAMEARIFADAAVCKVKADAFSTPQTTAVRAPTVLGELRFSGGAEKRATAALREWLRHFGTLENALEESKRPARAWSRAAAGWASRP